MVYEARNSKWVQWGMTFSVPWCLGPWGWNHPKVVHSHMWQLLLAVSSGAVTGTPMYGLSMGPWLPHKLVTGFQSQAERERERKKVNAVSFSWPSIGGHLGIKFSPHSRARRLYSTFERKRIKEKPTKMWTYFIYLFIYLFNLFLTVLGLRCCARASLVASSGGYSLLRCAGFSLWWLLLLQSTGSRCTVFSSCGSQALECRVSRCGAWA